jgi:hypothetical protein
MDDSGIRCERFRGKGEFQRSTGEKAVAAFAAVIGRLAGEIGRSERLVIVGDDHLEVFPKVGRAEGTVGRSAGADTRLRKEKPAEGLGEQDLYENFNEVWLAAMIEKCLLRAEISMVMLGVLHLLRERSKETDFGDMRTDLWQRWKLHVPAVEGAQGFIVALAEEVGLPDGGVRERCIERGAWNNPGQRRGEKARNGAEQAARHSETLTV